MALGKKIRNFDLRGRFIPRSKNEMERERESGVARVQGRKRD